MLDDLCEENLLNSQTFPHAVPLCEEFRVLQTRRAQEVTRRILVRSGSEKRNKD